MRTTARAVVVAVLVGSALCGSAFLGTGVSAHHAHPGFDADRTATVTGTIESIAFQNPHVLIWLRGTDSKRYLVEWQSAGALNEAPNRSSTPVKPSTFAAGETIVVTGSPSRDASLHAIATVREIYRPKDGWRWSGTSPK